MIEINKISKRVLWYVIGYIVTDGNLSKDGRHICIVSKDLEHLEKMRLALLIKTPVGKKWRSPSSSRECGQLQFSDVKFYRFLQSINIRPRKSLTQGIIPVPPKFFKDFLRGTIDGDGSIFSWVNNKNGHTQWIIKITSGAEVFSNWLLIETEKICKVRGRIHVRKAVGRNPIYIVKFGKLAAHRIIKKIYYQDCLCLERKLLLAKLCLLDKPKMLHYRSVNARVL